MRIAAAAVLAFVATAALATETLPGVYALPEGQAKVTATLAATPGPGGQVALDVAMTAVGQSRPVTRYETELSKQLHVIAVSSDFRTFVHEHGDRPGPDGHFHVSMLLPRPGLYHVYADGVPAGMGQQVMRFELKLGDAPAAPAEAPRPGGLEASDGGYSARFDPFELHAGREGELGLHLSRGGKPATGVTPFLGVAAHAVFVDAADLSYVHVHAMPAAAGDGGMAGMEMPSGAMPVQGMRMPEMGGMAMPGTGGMEGMPGALPAGSRVSPDLTLHVRAPKAGTYLLWVQFMAGGGVRTVPFVVAVT